MELTSKVNQIDHFKAKVLFAICAVFLGACTTLPDKDGEEDKEQKIFEQQMGIIINHLNLGEPKKAHFELRPLLSDKPDSPELHNLMGLAYMGLKEAKLAEKYFRKAFDLNADPAFALNLTSSLIEQKRYRSALTLLRKFKKDDLKNYNYPERFQHNTGLAFERMNKKKLAVKYYRRALAKNPSNYQTLMQLGRLYQVLSKPKLAEPIFQQAAEVCLRCYEPIKRRSDILLTMGRRQEAVRMLIDYIEIEDLRPQDVGHARRYVSKLEPKFFKRNVPSKNN